MGLLEFVARHEVVIGQVEKEARCIPGPHMIDHPLLSTSSEEIGGVIWKDL